MSLSLDTLVALGPWLWLAAALLMLTLETIIPGLHFAWFGAASALIGAGLLALAAGGIAPPHWVWQLAAFGLISGGMILWVARAGRHQRADSDLPDLNRRGDQLIGRKVTVETAFTGGRGRVRVGDTIWGAEATSDLPAGAGARVVGSDGAVLKVEAV